MQIWTTSLEKNDNQSLYVWFSHEI